MASILHLIGKILDKTLNTNSVHMALFVAHNEIDDLSKALSLSREAALFLSVFTNLGDSEVLILSDIAKHISCNTLEIIKYFPFVDELLEKGYIERYKGNDKGYIVPDAVLRALQKNEPYDILQNYQKNLVKADAIKKKRLFYNDADRADIFRIAELLMPETFRNLQDKLSEMHYSGGFTCLLYGPSGTGKTESVYQIARITKRDVLLVDATDIKSKWIGDSERNMKAVFDNYRRYVALTGNFPILLFNEADSFMEKRCDDTETWGEKEDNRLLNIILQEMETFDGIMFATTNRLGAFDSALHRRFLYKIELHLPDFETRKKIFRDKLSEFSESEIEWMSKKYNLSGGQIENISKKNIIDKVLYDSGLGLPL